MISVKTNFIPNFTIFHERETFKKRTLILSFCNKTNKSDSSSDEETPPPPKGDKEKQDILVRIAMLQTQKVRLTDFLDERSEYLTQFAEEAGSEIDQVGEDALRELDEASNRIMGNIESEMQAFEESMEMNRSEIKENEKKLADFEDQIEEDRNEGLFFKNLGQKSTTVDKEKAKEETEKIKEVNKKSAGSVIRKNIYYVLIGLVASGIFDAAISPLPDLRKIAILAVILVGLISQLVYEQSMLSKNGDDGSGKE